MVSCPKCGFQQPKDRYCARCGVDMESYSPPKQSTSSLIMGVLKPLAIFATVIVVIFLLLRSVTDNLNVDFDFTPGPESSESTTIGMQANSVRVDSPQRQAPSPNPQAATAPRRAMETVSAPAAAVAPAPVPIPEQLITVSIVEVFIPEQFRSSLGKAILTNEPQILNTFYSETINIRTDPVNFRFEDEFLVYDITVQVTAHADAKNTFRTILRRNLKTPTAQAIASIETTDTLELVGYSIIVDTLPRDQRLQPVTSLLTALAQSQSYLARASELAVIVHFEPLQALE